MGTIGVKWVLLFLKYWHHWIPVFMRDHCQNGSKESD